MTSDSVLGSFRDPNGFVFKRDGVVYRQVNPAGRDAYDALLQSGLYETLVNKDLLVSHAEVEPASVEATHAYKVLLPDQVGFISYPYEWCFSQLKAAALLTLSAQRIALDHGMTLRDASAFNVQFHRGEPVLVDTLSFGPSLPGEPWVAYRQFCQHFLGPLSLMALRDTRVAQLLRANLDGIPLELTSRLLPSRSRVMLGLAIHVHAHARSQRRHGSLATTEGVRDPKPFTRTAFYGLLDSLSKCVQRLDAGHGTSAWIDYYQEGDSYSSTSLSIKEQLVRAYLTKTQPQTVWDLGANTGRFSQLASGLDADVVAFEQDHAAVDTHYNTLRRNGDARVLPLLADLLNPSPALGWAHTERDSLAARGPCDTALALALVHHLAIHNNVPFQLIAAFMQAICHSLIIEFVPKDDPKVQQMLARREDVFDRYSREEFLRAFERHFRLEAWEPLPGSKRSLYLMRAR